MRTWPCIWPYIICHNMHGQGCSAAAVSCQLSSMYAALHQHRAVHMHSRVHSRTAPQQHNTTAAVGQLQLQSNSTCTCTATTDQHVLRHVHSSASPDISVCLYMDAYVQEHSSTASAQHCANSAHSSTAAQQNSSTAHVQLQQQCTAAHPVAAVRVALQHYRTAKQRNHRTAPQQR